MQLDRDHSELTRQYVYVNSDCRAWAAAYTGTMPKLWAETIETHRREVRDAILATTAALAAEHGLLSVTMSQIAEVTGIGRATLYKYFPDVDTILITWHERQIAGHLDHLATVRDRASDPGERLETALRAYAVMTRESGHHDNDLAAFLHRGDQVAQAQQQLHEMMRDLLAEASDAGVVRDDVVPDELAAYCLYAVTAARGLHSKTAAHRLVKVILAGLAPPV